MIKSVEIKTSVKLSVKCVCGRGRRTPETYNSIPGQPGRGSPQVKSKRLLHRTPIKDTKRQVDIREPLNDPP